MAFFLGFNVYGLGFTVLGFRCLGFMVYRFRV